MTLDRLDVSILNMLQDNCMMPHAQIGEKAGLSGSAVRRRIERLRKAGVIEREVAILSSRRQGAGILVIVAVTFDRETPKTVGAFKEQMRRDPRVLQCYATAGQFDYMLVVTAENPSEYESWGEEALLVNKMIRRYDSFVVWSTVKSITKRHLRAT